MFLFSKYSFLISSALVISLFGVFCVFIVTYLATNFLRQRFQEVSCFFQQIKFKYRLFHFFIISVAKIRNVS